MKKKLAILTAVFFGLGLLLVSPALAVKAKDFKDPVISLELFEVPQYDGYWYFSKTVKPTKGDTGDRGACLPMSFLLNIENPNSFPVLLEEIKFTVAFDKVFELVTVNNQDSCWIPAGKTDQVRVTTMITVRSALLSLLVTGGFKLKEMGISPWEALEKWWRGVPEYTVPVSIKEGAFSFNGDGVIKILPFEAEVQ